MVPMLKLNGTNETTLNAAIIWLNHGYLEEDKSMIHSFTITFGAKYLTGMVTSCLVFLPTKLSVLLKNIFFVSLKSTKITSKILISEVHVTYSLINMLYISTGIFDDKLRPQILSVGTTANSPLTGTQ